MSDGYRNGAFALGLVLGAGAALNLFLWLDYQSHHQADQAAYAQNDPDYSEVGTYWDGMIGTFVSPSDTLAQWIMAAFTIAATVVLVFTLRSANKTNAAAIDAAQAAIDANKILRNEQRPWVTIDRDIRCEFSDHNATHCRFAWNFNFINKGKTPAYNISRNIKIIKAENISEIWSELDEFVGHCVGKHGVNVVPILFPGEMTQFIKYKSSLSQTYKTTRDNKGIIKPEVVTGDYFGLLFCVTYQLGLDENAPMGLEARAFNIRDDSTTIGPWRHKLLEFTSNRIVR